MSADLANPATWRARHAELILSGVSSGLLDAPGIDRGYLTGFLARNRGTLLAVIVAALGTQAPEAGGRPPGVPPIYRTLAGDPEGARYSRMGNDVTAHWSWGEDLVTLATRETDADPASIHVVRRLQVTVERTQFIHRGVRARVFGSYVKKGGSVTQQTIFPAGRLAVIPHEARREKTDRWGPKPAVPTEIPADEVNRLVAASPHGGLGSALRHAVGNHVYNYGRDVVDFDLAGRAGPDLAGFKGWTVDEAARRSEPRYPDGRLVPVEGETVKRWMEDEAGHSFVFRGIVKRHYTGPSVVEDARSADQRRTRPMPYMDPLMDRFWTREDEHDRFPPARFGALASAEARHLVALGGQWIPNAGDAVVHVSGRRGTIVLTTQRWDSTPRLAVRLESTAGLSPTEATELERANGYDVETGRHRADWRCEEQA